MALSNATIGGVADPRLGAEPDAIGSYHVNENTGATVPEHWSRGSHHDPHIKFEEYHYWADKTRAYEKRVLYDDDTPKKTSFGQVFVGGLKNRKQRKLDLQARTDHTIVDAPTDQGNEMEKSGTEKVPYEKKDDLEPREPSPPGHGVSEDEWHQAARAARTATWTSVFFLITTDILGPFSVPWAMKKLGYGPGAALYTVFAAMAAYSGYQLWQTFLGLDSDKYPVKNYGDLAFRIFGSWARHVCNILQSFQFFLNVALLIEGNGQSIGQLANGPNGTGYLCFTVCELVFMIAGVLLGQIRTLQRLGYVANIAVWMNLFVIFMTMGVVSNVEPNYEANFNTESIPRGPIKHSAGLPEGTPFEEQINGLMQAVFSYGGATLFCELMAEMRRPWDFWKGLVCAELLIFSMYLTFGMVVYSEQGQFAYNPAYQGIPGQYYAWQTVGNVFAVITGLIAAALYGNIGIKVLYANVGREFMHAPALETKKGKIIWVFLIPVYWACAFIIAAAIPQISNLSAFVGAACILQFSYTFPPILSIGYNCLKDSAMGGDTHDASSGTVVRGDSGIKRWARGFMKKPFRNGFDTIYALGAAVTAVLGIYTSIKGMHETFSTTPITSFGCLNPAG